MSTPAAGAALGGELASVIQHAACFVTTEYASLSRAGDPVT